MANPKLVGFLLAASLAACESSAPIGSRTDGGTAAHDGGSPDAGRLRIDWPEPLLTIEGATDPALVRSPSGALTLIYLHDDKLWAHRDPPQGTPVEIAEAPGNPEMSVAASPDEDRSFVVWTGRHGLLLAGLQPDGPAFDLIDGYADLSAPGASWVRGMPVVTGVTNEVWVGSDHYPPSFLALAVTPDAPRTLPEPAADQVIEASANPYHHWGESHPVIETGDGDLLLFRTHWTPDPADPSGEAPSVRWHLLKMHRDGSGAASGYLVPKQTGYMALPTWAAWVQPHPLGGGRWALTWGSSESSLVYDVYVAGLAIAADGTPSLSTAPVNVSMTTGQTQNSDHALLRPTGEGRVWIAWRETDFGPMVALLDGVDFHVLALGGPPAELFLDQRSSIGAQVDSEGALHLAAGFNDGAQRIRYFRIALP